MSLPARSQKSVLPSTWNVPEVFQRRLGTQYGRQRMMESEGHLLLVLHAPPQADDDERQGRLFWLSPENEWQSTEQGSGLASLETHVEEFANEIEAIDELVDKATKSEEYFQALDGWRLC